MHCFVLDGSAISVTYTCIIACASMILYLGSVSCCHGDSPNQTGWMRKESACTLREVQNFPQQSCRQVENLRDKIHLVFTSEIQKNSCWKPSTMDHLLP